MNGGKHEIIELKLSNSNIKFFEIFLPKIVRLVKFSEKNLQFPRRDAWYFYEKT